MQLLVAVAAVAMAQGASAQQRVSICEEQVTVQNGRKYTVHKELFLHPNGRLVVEQVAANERTVYVTNALGEAYIYAESTNQVVVVGDKEMSSDKELLSMFASGSYVDMALPQYGYKAEGVRREGDLLIKNFTPASRKAQGVARVELVMQRHLPICMVYYKADDTVLRKVYYSRYQMGTMPMPMRVTDIEYGPAGDSTVRLSTYSRLMVGAEADSEMFDFVIPADAERVSLGQQGGGRR